MRCQQARTRLDEYKAEPARLAGDTELMAHLNHCPGCQLVAEADRSLARAFAELSQQETKPAPYFDAMVTRVEALAADRSNSTPIANTEEERTTVMSKIAQQMSRRPSLTVSLGVIGLLLLVSMLVPFSYQDNLGYEVAFAGVDKDLALDEIKLQELLTKLGIEDAVIDVTGCESTCNVKFSEIGSPDDAKLLMVAFEQIGNNELIEQPKAVFETKDGNVFTGVLHEMAGTEGPHEFVVYSDGDDKDKLHEIVIDRLGSEFEATSIWIQKNCVGGDTIDISGHDGEMIFVSECEDGAQGSGALIELIEGHDGHELGLAQLNELHEEHSLGDAEGNVFVFKTDPNAEIGHVKLGTTTEGWTVSFRDGEIDQAAIDELIAAGVNVKIIEISDAGSNDDASAAKENGLPEGYSLGQNYPNPFNPETQIDFSIGQAGPVSLTIFNIKGQTVSTLVDSYMSAGDHTVTWDGTNSSGEQVATGIYLYRLAAGEMTTTRKMNLIK